MKLTIAGAVGVSALMCSAVFAAEGDDYVLWQSTEAGESLVAVSGEAEGAAFAVASGADADALDILSDDEASLAIAGLKDRAGAASSEHVAMADEMDHEMMNDDMAEVGDMADMAETEDMAVIDQDMADMAETATGPADEAGAGEAKVHKIVLVKKVSDEKTDKKGEQRRIIKLKTDDAMADADIEALIADARADIAEGDDAAEIEVEKQIIAAGDDEDAALLAEAGEGQTLILQSEEDGAETRLVRISGVSADAARQFIDGASGLDDAEKASMKTSLGL